MYLHLEMGLSKEKRLPFFFSTDILLISPNLNEIWVHFFFHSFSHTVLLVDFCYAVLFSQVSGCALFPLKHEVWIPSGNISVGHTVCGSLPLLSWSLCACLWQGTWESSSAEPPCKKWMRKDAFHLTSVQCKLDGPWRLFCYSASKAWKDISGQSGQGCFFFPLQLLLSWYQH